MRRVHRGDGRRAQDDAVAVCRRRPARAPSHRPGHQVHGLHELAGQARAESRCADRGHRRRRCVLRRQERPASHHRRRSHPTVRPARGRPGRDLPLGRRAACLRAAMRCRGRASRAGASHGSDWLRALRARRGGCGYDGEKRSHQSRRASVSRDSSRKGRVHGLRQRMRAVDCELRCREDALLRQRQQVRTRPRRAATPMERGRTCHPARSAIASCPQHHRRRAAPDRVVWQHRSAGESRFATHRPHGLDGALRVPTFLAHVTRRAWLQRHAAPARLRGRPHERGVGDGAFRERVLSGQDVARALLQPVRGRLRCRLHAALHAQLPLPGPDRIRQRACRQCRDGPKWRRSRAHRVARARQLPSRAIRARRGLDGAGCLPP